MDANQLKELTEYFDSSYVHTEISINQAKTEGSRS